MEVRYIEIKTSPAGAGNPLLRGRLYFEDEDGNGFPPAPFPSMVVVYNGDHQCLN